MTKLSEQVLREATAEVIDLDFCSKGLMRGDYSCQSLSIRDEREKCRRYDCPWGYYQPHKK